MSNKAPTPAEHSKAAREARLAEQLRANLARRKAQARGRADAVVEVADDGDDNKRQDS